MFFCWLCCNKAIWRPWEYVCSSSLLLEQSPELLKRAVLCPGFLHTAVLCYACLFQLFLDGHTPNLLDEPHVNQVTRHGLKCILYSLWVLTVDQLTAGQYWWMMMDVCLVVRWSPRRSWAKPGSSCWGPYTRPPQLLSPPPKIARYIMSQAMWYVKRCICISKLDLQKCVPLIRYSWSPCVWSWTWRWLLPSPHTLVPPGSAKRWISSDWPRGPLTCVQMLEREADKKCPTPSSMQALVFLDVLLCFGDVILE